MSGMVWLVKCGTSAQWERAGSAQGGAGALKYFLFHFPFSDEKEKNWFGLLVCCLFFNTIFCEQIIWIWNLRKENAREIIPDEETPLFSPHQTCSCHSHLATWLHSQSCVYLPSAFQNLQPEPFIQSWVLAIRRNPGKFSRRQPLAGSSCFHDHSQPRKVVVIVLLIPWNETLNVFKRFKGDHGQSWREGWPSGNVQSQAGGDKRAQGTPEKAPLWKSWGKVMGADSEQALGGKLGQGNGFEVKKLIRKPGWSLSAVVSLYFYAI